MSDIQNIAITSTQTVPQPKPHTTYTVQGMLQSHLPPDCLPFTSPASPGTPSILPHLTGLDGHAAPYLISVSTATRTWDVSRRYNDFVALDAELRSSVGKEPPVGLPGKHMWSLTRSVYDEKVGRVEVYVSCTQQLQIEQAQRAGLH